MRGSKASRSNGRFHPKIRFKSCGLRGAVEHATVGCRGDRHKPVSARLKGLAEDSQGKGFCIHAPKLTPEPQCCQLKDVITVRPHVGGQCTSVGSGSQPRPLKLHSLVRSPTSAYGTKRTCKPRL